MVAPAEREFLSSPRRLTANAAHATGTAAEESVLFPDTCGFTASDVNRPSPARLITADAGGAAIIAGAPATGPVESFAGEELSPSDAVHPGPLAVGPGSSGDVEVEDVEVDDDDPSPELLSDEPMPDEEEVSARR